MRSHHLFLGWSFLVGTLVLVAAPSLWAQEKVKALTEEEKRINAAVDKGIAYLKGLKLDSTDGNHIAARALVALTLLECGGSKADVFIDQTVTEMRKFAFETTHTYHLSLIILLLARFDDPMDVPLLEALGTSLLEGQRKGLWDYMCPRLEGGEARDKLLRACEQAKNAPRPKGNRKPTDLQPEIQKKIASMPAIGLREAGGDLSNTQFAVLGLWAAHRVGVPIDHAMLACDMAVRATQTTTGLWPYQGGQDGTATMTCAGLVVLAVARGRGQELAQELGKPSGRLMNNDLRINAGIAALSTGIGLPRSKGGHIEVLGDKAGKLYYFLWSLERVAVFFDLKTVGNKDWYAWGADVLVANQLNDGSWKGEFAEYGPVDTCFALLFLKKANIAPDLTRTLRGGVSDPGERVLKVDPKADLGGETPLNTTPNTTPNTTSIPSPNTKTPETTPAKKLANDLANAASFETPPLLAKFKEGSGSSYTLALAEVIEQLSGEKRKQAREALAERLAGLSKKSVQEWLLYEQSEIKQAAALACAMKEDRSAIPQLIPLLLENDPRVVRVTHLALKSLSGKDFGPANPAASQKERTEAAQSWQAWWAKQADK